MRDGDEVVLVPPDGEAVRVEVPAIGELRSIRALRLSRDGARVAVVAGPRGQEQLLVGVVIRENGSAKIDRLRPLDIGASPASDVSWADSLTVIALARSGEQDSSLHAVDISGMTGGRSVVRAGLPAPPTAVAAGPALPLLTVAAGNLWRAPAIDEAWTQVSEKGGGAAAPAYPG